MEKSPKHLLLTHARSPGALFSWREYIFEGGRSLREQPCRPRTALIEDGGIERSARRVIGAASNCLRRAYHAPPGIAIGAPEVMMRNRSAVAGRCSPATDKSANERVDAGAVHSRALCRITDGETLPCLGNCLAATLP